MPGSQTPSSRPPTPLSERQRAWSAMRVFKVFTVVQILSVAEIGRPNLRKYMRFLLRAGYLRIIRPQQKGKSEGHALWRLVRNSGPKHPLPRRDGSGVYDPNHDALYPYREEAPAHDG